MPGGDQTGPMGAGPRTGRGLGVCAGYPVSGKINSMPGRGMAYGRGFGRGAGMGRGYARGFGWRSAGGFGYAKMGAGISAQDEAAMLKGQVQYMQDEMEVLNSRIKELESRPDSDEPVMG